MRRTALALVCVPALVAQSPADFDALLTSRFAADQAGASVLVFKAGKVVYAKGFGLANRELQVPNNPELVYRIGSVTKQFTAAAIMTLVEDGKVALDAPISRYLEGLPEAWRPVTVTQLLTHTSGIPSYTDGPGYGARMREDLPGMKLLEAHVWTKPMDFAPGTKWKYNNSGYYLLGLLVEKASGKTYADYLQTRFFGPLGMAHTRYGTETDFIPGMASGYAPEGAPAPYLSMTQPYAAGSLVSTAGDLARWTAALHEGKAVKAESLKLMTTPVKTSDGQEHPYGFGLELRRYQGRRIVGHGGGINGFVCQVDADPAAKMVAVVLCNTVDPKVSPDFLTRRLLGLANGTPVKEPVAVALPPEKLSRLVGTYETEGRRRTILFEQGKLFSRTGGGTYELIPTSELTFALKDADTLLRFELKGNDVLGVRRQVVDGPEEGLATKVVAEATKVAATVDPASFDALVGTYQLAPGFELRLWREGGKFFTQATGQGVIEIFPLSETRYFPKVMEATLDFEKGPDGKATQLTLTQGGRKMPAKRVK